MDQSFIFAFHVNFIEFHITTLVITTIVVFSRNTVPVPFFFIEDCNTDKLSLTKEGHDFKKVTSFLQEIVLHHTTLLMESCVISPLRSFLLVFI